MGRPKNKIEKGLYEKCMNRDCGELTQHKTGLCEKCRTYMCDSCKRGVISSRDLRFMKWKKFICSDCKRYKSKKDF